MPAHALEPGEEVRLRPARDGRPGVGPPRRAVRLERLDRESPLFERSPADQLEHRQRTAIGCPRLGLAHLDQRTAHQILPLDRRAGRGREEPIAIQNLVRGVVERGRVVPVLDPAPVRVRRAREVGQALQVPALPVERSGARDGLLRVHRRGGIRSGCDDGCVRWPRPPRDREPSERREHQDDRHHRGPGNAGHLNRLVGARCRGTPSRRARLAGSPAHGFSAGCDPGPGAARRCTSA